MIEPWKKLPDPSRVLMNDVVTLIDQLSKQQVFSDIDEELTTQLFVELQAGPLKRDSWK